MSIMNQPALAENAAPSRSHGLTVAGVLLIALVFGACADEKAATPDTVSAVDTLQDAADVPTEPDADSPDEGPALELPPITDSGPVTLPDAGIGKQPLGGVCTSDEGCIDGYCNTAFPGGYCSALCSSHDECPNSAKCYADILPGGPKMCWKLCSAEAGCRGDQRCDTVCTPRCPQLICNIGYACQESSGKCVFSSQVPACEPTPELCNGLDDDCDGVTDQGCGPELSESAEKTVILDMGAVQVGGGGLSKTLSFSLSSAARSFTVLIIDRDDSGEATSVWKLTGPGKEVLSTGNDIANSPIRMYPGLGAVAMQVPNTPNVDIVPKGTYSFSIYRGGDAGTAWVYVIQTLGEAPETQMMDVNLWFVGLPWVDASTASSDGRFSAMIAEFTKIMKSHGVIVNKVYAIDVPNPEAQTFTYVDVGTEGFVVDEHAELLALSESLPKENRGINFFFVQGFNGWGLLGKAGGIPGPALYNGSYGSGVVVSLGELYEHQAHYSVPLIAETMAHELGHQLGLFHTSEKTGTLHDPIPDTSECTDSDGDGVVDYEECEGKGVSNLMFWSVSFSSKLTAGQKFVIHRNAALY